MRAVRRELLAVTAVLLMTTGAGGAAWATPEPGHTAQVVTAATGAGSPVVWASGPAAQVRHLDRSLLSAPAVPAAGCTKPASVVNVRAVAGDDQVTVTWDAPATGAAALTGYLVREVSGASPGLARATARTTRTATLTGVAAGSPTVFAVTAVNACGRGPATPAPAVTATGSNSTYAGAVLADFPSAFYRLGERDGAVAADSATQAADAVLSTDAMPGRPGALLTDSATAVGTAGSWQSIVSSPATLPVGNAARTVSVWVNTTTADAPVVSWGDPTRYSEDFTVGVRRSAITFARGPSVITAIPTDHPVSDGQWHQIVVSYDGSTVRAYLDGRAQGATTPDGGLATAGGVLSLGVDVLQYNYYVGDVQDLAVFPSALSPDRVAAQYAASGHARPAPVAVPHAAVAGTNRVIVTWGDNSDPDQPTTTYILRVVSGRDTGRTVSVAGDATAAAVAGLAAGDASFSIVAINQSGTGSAAVTNHVVVGGSTATFDAVVLAAGPSAFYRLADATATVMTDSSARAADGTYSTGARQGLDAPLVGDTATAPDPNGGGIGVAPADVPLYDSTRSVEAWFRASPDADPSLYPDGTVETLVSWGGPGTDSGFAVGYDNTSVVVDAGNDRLGFPGASALHDGAWHQVVVTYDGDSVRAYVDGRLLGRNRFDNPLDTAPPADGGDGRVYLGAVAPGLTTGLQPNYGGVMADVVVLPTVLSAGDAAAHFAASALTTPASPTGVTATPTANAATVSWTAPVASASRPVTGYRVTALAGAKVAGSESVAPESRSAVLTGLAAGPAYTFRVEARNASGWGVAASSSPVAVTGTASTYASTVLTARPVAYYRLGDSGPTLTDSSGATRDGAYNPRGGALHAAGGAPVADPDGSAAVTGQSPYTGGTAVAGVPLPAQNDARTATVWINDASLGDGAATLLSWGSNNPGQQFSLLATKSSVGVAVDGSTRWVGSPSLADGMWHLLAVTYDGATWTTYVDGQRIGSGDFGGAIATDPDGPLTVGGYVDGYGGPTGARLDELAIFDKALSASQVSALFVASGYGRPAAAPAVSVTAGTNTAVVAWTAPMSPGVPLTDYVVTAVTGGRPVNSVVVKGTARSTVVGGLAGATPYAFTVTARNAYGSGPAASSSAVTVDGSAMPYSAAVLADTPAAYFRLADSAGTSVSESAGHQVTADIAPGSTNGTSAGPVRNDPSTGLLVSYEDAIARPVVALPLNDSARTVEVWVKLPAGTRASGTVVGWGRNGNGTSFGVTVSPDSIGVTIGGTAKTFATPASIADDHWHLVDVTYGSAGVVGYLDAASLGTATFKKALLTQSSPLGLGSSAMGWDGPGQQFALAQVSVYGSALGSDRIAAHFTAAGASRPTAPTSVSAQGGANRATVTWTPPSAGGERILAYQVSAGPAGSVGSSVTVLPTARNAVLGGLPAVVGATFRARALNAYGWGDWSSPTAGVAVTGTPSTYASTILGLGPSAYLRLGDSSTAVLADSAGRAAAAFYTPAAALGQKGAIVGDPDKAVGVNGSAVASARTALPVGDAPRTAAVWFRSTQPDGSRSTVLSWGSEGTARSVQVQVDPTGIGVDIGGEASFVGAGTPEDGAWHLIALTTSGRAYTLYLDGKVVQSATFAHRLDTASAPLEIGGDYRGASGPYSAMLDDAVVFPTALPAATIAQLFATAGYAAAGAPGTPTAVAGTNQATVSWTAASSPGADLQSYRVVAYLGSAVVGVVSVAGTSTSAVVSGLSGGASYTFSVTARNAYGIGPTVVSTAVTPTGPANTYASSVRALGPSAYYRLGDTGDLADSTGGPDGTYAPTTVREQKGVLPNDPDKAVSTSGQGVGSAAATLPTGAQARSVVVWVKSTYGGAQWLVAWGTSDAHRGFEVAIDGGAVYVEVEDQELVFPASTSATDGAWHQVAVSSDGGQAAVWIDGVSLGNLTFSSPLATAPGPVQIGGTLYGGRGVYGSLDELAVFPHTLTTAQVRAIYTAGRS